MIDYVRMVPLLEEAISEQGNVIDSLNIRLTNLELIVQSCCSANRGSNNNSGATGQNGPVNVKLQNADNYILYQNEPNPYSNNTSIRYFLPENVTDAKITFQDNTGKTLKEVKLIETGQGSLQVDGSELINGIYTYSLVIGSKIIDTKKMVKLK